MRLSSVLYTALFLAVQAQRTGVQIPEQQPRPDSSTSHGCFNSRGDWEEVAVENLSTGSCIDTCIADEALVAAVGGEVCYCGSTYPALDDQVDDERCNYPCPVYPPEACGGIRGGSFYSVFNTGLQVDVPYEGEEDEDEDEGDDEDEASTTTSTSTGTTPSATSGEQTSEPSASDAPEDNNDEDEGGSNIGGIVGGVVGGVAAVGLIFGVGFWWLRRRRNRSIEEEHRRNAAVNSFIAGAKPPGSSGGISMTDSRMDPTLAHRRMSDGSIADNQDYSRKILRVTNA